ncbi:uncharacterized protein DNG_09170 [Cephalotrichum gorgonifer]|uniref:Uncharacterized protein n=1 Tax=Cephalotrichum gorgonifer TaxID=2041049 RepID=A0AAE8SZ14_9PEZI|nr:uncharacterized protein DNG_09170 [Cephalotrichum gorgonifer]
MSLSTLQPYLHYIQHVRTRTAITTLVATAAAGLLIPGIHCIVRSYRGFLALGRGGIPYNFFGWLLQASLKLIARTDTTETSHYSRPEILQLYSPLADLCFLAGPPPLQERSGARPTVPFYTAPQRQTTEIATEATRGRMESFLRAVFSSGAGARDIH